MITPQNQTEKVILLGFIPLLATTAGIYTALAATVIVLAATALIGGCDLALQKLQAVRLGYSGATRWMLLMVLAGALSWFLGTIAPFAFPLADTDILFLQLSGLTPIVFLSASKPHTLREVASLQARFIFLMLALAAIREILGQGKFAGLLVTGYVTPAQMFQSPVGAFLLLGATALLSRWIPNAKSARTGGSPA